MINADSMQVYGGLDIITNKVPENEREGIPHHLLGFKNMTEQYFVQEWIHDAIPVVREILSMFCRRANARVRLILLTHATMCRLLSVGLHIGCNT